MINNCIQDRTANASRDVSTASSKEKKTLIIGGITLTSGITVGGIQLMTISPEGMVSVEALSPDQQVTIVDSQNDNSIVGETTIDRIQSQIVQHQQQVGLESSSVPLHLAGYFAQEQLVIDFHNYKAVTGLTPPEIDTTVPINNMEMDDMGQQMVIDFHNYKAILGVSPPEQDDMQSEQMNIICQLISSSNLIGSTDPGQPSIERSKIVHSENVASANPLQIDLELNIQSPESLPMEDVEIDEDLFNGPQNSQTSQSCLIGQQRHDLTVHNVGPMT